MPIKFLVIILNIVALLTNKNMIFVGLSIADILTTFSIFFMLFRKGPVKIKKNAFIIWALLFLFSAGLAFLFTSINLSTDNLEFIKAFLKLYLYILNFILLISFISLSDLIENFQVVTRFILFLVIIGFITTLAEFGYRYGLTSDWHKYLYFGYLSPGEFGLAGESSWVFKGVYLVKTRGIAMEPSLFALSLSTLVVIRANLKETPKFDKIDFLAIISLTSTLSMSGALLLTFVICRWLRPVKSIKLKTLFQIIVLIIVFICLFPLIEHAVFGRIWDIFNGTSRSGSIRLFSTFLTTKAALEENLFFGVGLGNIEVILKDLSFAFDTGDPQLLKVKYNIQVVPFYFVATMGLVGLFFKIVWYYLVLKRDLFIGVFFMATVLIHGGQLESAYWTSIALLLVTVFKAKELKNKTY